MGTRAFGRVVTVVLSCLGWFSACTCPSASSSERRAVSATIGSEGGKIDFEAGNSLVRVDVPPGALIAPLELSLAVLRDRLPEASGPTIELLPHGTRSSIGSTRGYDSNRTDCFGDRVRRVGQV
jgi:hypothetical protein